MRCDLPNSAFLFRIVLLACLAVEGLAEELRVRGRANDSELAQRVHASDDGPSQVLVPVLAAPDLTVVDEEELLGGEVEARQRGLGSVLVQPSLVGLQEKIGRQKSTKTWPQASQNLL